MIGAPVGERRAEARVVLRRRGEQDGAGHLLEMAPRDRRVRVVRGDDLALFGELQAAVDRARRLPEDRPVGGAAAPTDGAAAAVEQGQLDAVLRAAATSADCAWWSIQAAARNPDSLFESE